MLGKTNLKLRICSLLLAAVLLGGCAGAGGGAANQGGSGGGSTAQSEAAGRTPDSGPASRDLFAMDTFMTLTVYGPGAEEAADAAVAEIERLDRMLSTGETESEIGALNARGSGKLSEDAAALVERSLAMYEETEGAFDIAVYPLMEAWGFTDDNLHVPEAAEIQALLPLADPHDIRFDAATGDISFMKEGMKIDLGGAGKGYTSGRLIELLRERGVEHALVNLGGNVQTLGKKPDGSLWRIGIEDPEDVSKTIGVLSVSDCAVITSGDYERFFEEDGVRYHHILDPETGYPAEGGLSSVTIVSPDGTLADMLATSLFIMGTERAAAYCAENAGPFEAVLFTKDREMYATPGIRDSLNTKYQLRIIGE